MFLTELLVLNTSSALVFLVVLVTSWYWLTWKPKNFPPSPGLALPFIGHLYLIGSNPRQRFKEWAKNHGNIFSLQMGGQSAVVISGFDLIKETLAKPAFSGRPVDDFMNVHFPHRRKGVVFSTGHQWQSERSTGLAILRNLGMGKNVLAEKISDELKFVVEDIVNTKGKPGDIKPIIYKSVSNIICSLIFGKRFSYEDPQFLRLLNFLTTVFHLFNGVTIINYWPMLRYIPFDPFQGKQLLNALAGLQKFSSDMVEDISQVSEQNDSNFIAAYFDEMRKQKEGNQPKYLDKISLARTIDDLFAAGTDTTSTTILWCILYSIHFPDIQERLHQEIVEHVGTERAPSVNDRSQLKYLNAYIMETQRLASIAPFSVAHLCTEEATLGGYSIPKGTVVIPNLDSVHHDAGIWADPQNFRPQRFIDDQGNLKSAEELIPFSIGKRICIGEALAKMELFLFMSNLFQKFQFVPVDPQNLPPLVEVFGITTPPVPYQVKCLERIA